MARRTFKTEPEEADWHASPEGRAAAQRAFRRAVRDGTLIVSNGSDLKRTDPAVLEELMQRAKETAMKPISIRLSIADIERAKAVAVKRGVGYQTVLKDIISKGCARPVNFPIQ